MAVDRDKVLRAAQKFIEGKRWDKAIAEFQRLIAEDPKDVRILLKVGDCHMRQEEYAEAIETYEVVARIYIEATDQKQAEPLKAVRVYKQILDIIDKRAPKLMERFGWVLPTLAELYMGLGLTSDASATYEDLATRLHKAGKEKEATEALKKVIELDPNNPMPRLRLAEAFSRAKETSAAIEQLGSAAELLVKAGRRDDALKVTERLLTIKADSRYARAAAKMYLERGQANDAMTALAKLQIAFKENPKDLDTLSLLAKAFDKLGQGAKAIEVLKEATRIAKEAKNLEKFDELLQSLVARAPDDDVVRQLVASRPRVQPIVEEESVIVVEEMTEEDLPPESEPVEAPPSVRLEPPQPDDDALRARQILQQADAYYAVRDYASAITILRDGVAMVPPSRELRAKLCDVLVEAGDHEGGIRQMLIFAQRLSIEGDVPAAAKLLDEVLLIDPAQADAIQMLRALGYDVAVPQAAVAYQQPAYAHQGYDPNAYDPNAYDAAASGAYQQYPQEAHQGLDFSDSYAGGAYAQQYPGYPAQGQVAVHYADAGHYPNVPQPSPSQYGGTLDEDVLEQIDFFANQGLLEDARQLLDDQLLRLPNHPMLLYKRSEIEQMGRPSYVPQVPAEGFAHKRSEYPPDENAEDIARMIEQIGDFAVEQPAAAAQAEYPQWNVDTVFQQFKAGVTAQISESDAATHYDLGVAYREMGMYADAINEFEVAARDPSRECVCRSVIGMIHLQFGNVDAAIAAFLRGLEAPQKTREQELALAYETADAYEARKNPEQALHYFKHVAQLDPNYRDPRGGVQDRIRRLEPSPAHPATARTPRQDLLSSDDFDAAFDDLFSSGKLP
ncbi:MAG: tetratricopeptide repeat protein [Polyangiaceae bacterium]|nr:tetratricopeptide repeat protein [Polyangiaceae bacterium]